MDNTETHSTPTHTPDTSDTENPFIDHPLEDTEDNEQIHEPQRPTLPFPEGTLPDDTPEVPYPDTPHPTTGDDDALDSDGMLPELEELAEEEYYLEQIVSDTIGVPDEDSAFEALNDNDDNFDYLLESFDDSAGGNTGIIETVSITEKDASTGVYVYTYPKLLIRKIRGKNRTTPPEEVGKTLFKIGSSSMNIQDTIDHVRQSDEDHADIVLIRIYPTVPSKALSMEHKFQHLLSTIEAQYEQADVPREHDEDHWFHTSLDILDGIAQTLELDVVDPRRHST
jgi:hypothetical protein